MRLGDLDALMERADEVTFMGFQAAERKKQFVDLVSAMVESCTTIDAVPVVRCKDCFWFTAEVGCPLSKSGYFKSGKPLPHENDFCSYGERKVVDGNG